MRYFLLSLAIFSIQGCTSGFYKIRYTPIAKTDEAYSLIGKQCELTESWYLIGWENFDNDGVIDSYVLQRRNNSSSRHIVDRIQLPKNSKLTITSIERNTNWKRFNDSYKFNISITGQVVKVHKTEQIERIKLSTHDVCSP